MALAGLGPWREDARAAAVRQVLDSTQPSHVSTPGAVAGWRGLLFARQRWSNGVFDRTHTLFRAEARSRVQHGPGGIDVVVIRGGPRWQRLRCSSMARRR